MDVPQFVQFLFFSNSANSKTTHNHVDSLRQAG